MYDHAFKEIFRSFNFFLNNSGKYILFTSLFYSLWLVRACFLAQNFELHAFPGRMIGIATLQGFDVGARVSLFYKCIALLFCSFTGFTLIGHFIFKRVAFLILSTETKIINYTSVAGTFFFLFQVFGYKIEYTLELIYLVHGFMLTGILLRSIFFQKNELTIYSYTLIILLSISFYFFVADFSNFAGQFKNPQFLITTFITGCLLLVVINIFLKNTEDRNKLQGLNSLTYTLVPLAFLPFISVLKDEIFLILKDNQGFLNSRFFIYFFLLICLSGILFIRHKKTKKQLNFSQKDLIATYYFPAFIFSLVTYLNYNYYITYSDEIFEAANKYLPIMEFKLFGVIPTLEKFNSHLLSDYFFSGIYTLFNGLNGSEMELYVFLSLSISYVLYYYLVYYISRNAFISVFCVLLFPLCGPMLPEPFSIGIFAIFALRNTISTKQTLKKYLLFFITITGLILWRIDLGYTCMVAMSILLVYYHLFSRTFKINWVLLLKALGIVLGSIVLLLAFLSLYRDINLFKKIINALNYFVSAQTYGYSSIGEEDSSAFKMHYFIFPISIGIIIIMLSLRFKVLNMSDKQRLSYLSFIFICLFYLINFNRGLIQHSLIQGVDYFTSSFIYIIIPGAVFVFSQNKKQISKYIIFYGIAFFLLINYKMPDPKGSKSNLEKCLEKIRLSPNVDLSKIESRVKYKSLADKNKISPFVDFIKKNTTAKETFIDFSNNPMLFFYTKKITPSYFYQNPICSHNDFLQNVFVNDLKNYDTPYLVFSRNDYLSRDKVDDVPNILRHYRIAEYLYQNFKPYIIAGNYRVWKRNDVPDKNTKDTIYTFNKKTVSDSIINLELKLKKDKKYLARIILDKKTDILLNIISAGKRIPHQIEFVNDTLAYCVIDAKGQTCLLTLKNHDFHINKFQVIECANIPDLQGETPLSYDFMWLPYIWGTYDKAVLKEPILFESGVITSLDKTTGNTVNIYCKNDSKKVQKISFWFGNSNEKNKTSIVFNVFPSEREERYSLRVSSIYKWYFDKIDQAGITANPGVKVSKIQITKGM